MRRTASRDEGLWLLVIYENIKKGIFLSRPNRFIAEVQIGGNAEVCHVKNTGRCKELLIPGTKVIVNQSDNKNRSTKYDLISVWKGKRLINMDSQAPNAAFGEYLRQGGFIDGITLVKPEARYGSSRFDFYIEAGTRKAFIEVKGVTLEENGVVMFPDAPTERGIKHLKYLTECLAEGYGAYVVFVVQMKGVEYFTPNKQTHPAFGEALAAAVNAGVAAAAFDCVVTENEMRINGHVPIIL